MKIMSIALAVVFLALVLCASAEDAPFRTNVTVTAGSGSWEYPTAGVKKPYGEAFRIQAVLLPATAGQTGTVQVVDGSVTNTIGTKVAAANDTELNVTNDWWHFASDDVLITSTDTNTFTATIIGEER